MTTLPEQVWRAAAASHREEVERELAEVVHRRDRGQPHPVDDFLFHYYNLRPSQLAQWHPGAGVALEGAAEYADRPFYSVIDQVAQLDVGAFLTRRGATAATARELLAAATSAAPRFGCFGMHEWAMVYRLEPHETRHAYLPLRFPPDELAQIVEDVGCRCSHFDAFRFFTPAAKPLNLITPSRARQAELDQPGCLHVNMDLYRWAGKLSPAVSSAVLLGTFRLARRIRSVDMAASPYDLDEWGIEPIRVETSAGRAEYVELQKGFAAEAIPLRAALLEIVEDLRNRGPSLVRRQG